MPTVPEHHNTIFLHLPFHPLNPHPWRFSANSAPISSKRTRITLWDSSSCFIVCFGPAGLGGIGTGNWVRVICWVLSVDTETFFLLFFSTMTFLGALDFFPEDTAAIFQVSTFDYWLDPCSLIHCSNLWYGCKFIAATSFDNWLCLQPCLLQQLGA